MDAASAAVDVDRVRELSALRRRAYGPGAGIADDPVALARLEELEQLDHAVPADAAPQLIDEAPAIDRSDAIRDGASPAVVGITPARPAVPHRPPMHGLRITRVWASAAAAVIVAAIGVIFVIAAMAQPDAVLGRSAAPPEIAAFDGGALEYHGVSASQLVARESYQGIEVWSAVAADGRRCLFVGSEDRLWNGTCMPAGLDPFIDVTIYPYIRIELDIDLPNGSVVRFTLVDDAVEVRVGRGPVTD